MANEFVARNGVIALSNSQITGSLIVTNGITGDLSGTASFATNALTASYAGNVPETASFAISASQALNSNNASTASFVTPLVQNILLTGSLTSTANIQANKFVFTDGVINTNVGGQYIIATSGNTTYLYTGTSGLNINDATNGNINVSISNVGAVQTRGKLTVGAPGNDQDIAFGGSNAKLDWAGTGAQIFYSVGALQFSSVGSTNNMVLQQNGGALFNFGITGSLLGTSSFATQAANAATATSASFASNAATATTASYVLNAVSASFATQALSASFASNAATATSASFAATGSYADNFTVRNTLTAQTLVVTTVSSSVVYSSGSNVFGNQLSNTQDFTGSVRITGSLSVNGLTTVNGNQLITGSLTVGSGSIGSGENTLIVGLPPNGGAGEGGQILLSTTGGAYTSASMLDNYQNTFRVLSGTNAGSNRMDLELSHVTQNLRIFGDVVAYAASDKRLKKNIKPIENALDILSKVGGYTFDWDENFTNIHGHEGTDIGVVAQEFEEVLPLLVNTRDNGYKAVNYEKIVALLIQVDKEQQEIIKDQQRQIDELKELINIYIKTQ